MSFYKSKYKNFIDENSVQVALHLDKKVHKIVSDISEERGVPVALLILMAIDNELDQTRPFHYPCNIPDIEFIEGQYTEEASLIYQHIKTKPRDIESMMLNRRIIGIESKDIVLLALRELLHTGVIEAFKPKKSYFHYPKTYVRYRVKEIPNKFKPKYNRPRLIEEEED